MELLAEPLHLVGLRVEHLVLPPLRDRAQQRDQGRRGGEDDVAGTGLLEQVGHRLESCLEDRLPGEEQHHELGGVRQRLPVAPGPEVGDVLAQVLAEPAEGTVVLVGVVGAGEVEERSERGLGVDGDGASAGQRDDEVGPQPPVVEADLLGEVAVVDETGQLHGAAQVQLAPLAAHLRLAQRRGEGGRLSTQRLGRATHVGHLLVQLGLPGDPVVGQVAELVLQPLETVLHDRVVGDALLQRGECRVVGGPAARPQHPDQRAQREPDGEDERQGEEQGEGVHGASMVATTDSAVRSGLPKPGPGGRGRPGSA